MADGDVVHSTILDFYVMPRVQNSKLCKDTQRVIVAMFREYITTSINEFGDHVRTCADVMSSHIEKDVEENMVKLFLDQAKTTLSQLESHIMKNRNFFKDRLTTLNSEKSDDGSFPKDQSHVHAIQQTFSKLKHGLILDGCLILESLVADSVISEDDMESIIAKSDRRERNDEFLKRICDKCSYDQFTRSFLPALEKDHPHLEKLLQEALQSLPYNLEMTDNEQCGWCLIQDKVQPRKLADYLFNNKAISQNVHTDLRKTQLPIPVKWTLLMDHVKDQDVLFNAIKEKYPNIGKTVKRKGGLRSTCECSKDGSNSIYSTINAPMHTPSMINAPMHTPSMINAPMHTPSMINAPMHTPSRINAPMHTPSRINAPMHTPSRINSPMNTPSRINAPMHPPSDIARLSDLDSMLGECDSTCSFSGEVAPKKRPKRKKKLKLQKKLALIIEAEEKSDEFLREHQQDMDRHEKRTPDVDCLINRALEKDHSCCAVCGVPLNSPQMDESGSPNQNEHKAQPSLTAISDHLISSSVSLQDLSAHRQTDEHKKKMTLFKEFIKIYVKDNMRHLIRQVSFFIDFYKLRDLDLRKTCYSEVSVGIEVLLSETDRVKDILKRILETHSWEEGEKLQQAVFSLYQDYLNDYEKIARLWSQWHSG